MYLYFCSHFFQDGKFGQVSHFTLGLQIRPIRTESADKQQADEI